MAMLIHVHLYVFVMQTYNLSNKSELLVAVQAPEGKEGPTLVTLTTDLVRYFELVLLCGVMALRPSAVLKALSAICS